MERERGAGMQDLRNSFLELNALLGVVRWHLEWQARQLCFVLSLRCLQRYLITDFNAKKVQSRFMYFARCTFASGFYAYPL